MDTLQEVAKRVGHEAALKWADHRIECLEAEVRSNLQALRALSEAVLTGDQRAALIAQAVKDLLETKQSR